MGRLLSSSPWSCRNGVYTLSAMTTGRYASSLVILDPDNDSTYRQVGNGQSTLGAAGSTGGPRPLTTADRAR